MSGDTRCCSSSSFSPFFWRRKKNRKRIGKKIPPFFKRKLSLSPPKRHAPHTTQIPSKQKNNVRYLFSPSSLFARHATPRALLVLVLKNRGRESEREWKLSLSLSLFPPRFRGLAGIVVVVVVVVIACKRVACEKCLFFFSSSSVFVV